MFAMATLTSPTSACPTLGGSKDDSGVVSGRIFVGLDLEMIFYPRFLGSGPRNLSGSVSGLIFHPWISNGYRK